jgi:hypothetical protein
MTHFAKVENGIVTDILVAEQEFINSGAVGEPSLWIQTSINTRGGVHYAPNSYTPDNGVALRANYAIIGGTYDLKNDVFYSSRPLDINGVSCESWTISSPNWLWKPPIQMPTDNKQYYWDETNQVWIESN